MIVAKKNSSSKNTQWFQQKVVVGGAVRARPLLVHRVSGNNLPMSVPALGFPSSSKRSSWFQHLANQLQHPASGVVTTGSCGLPRFATVILASGNHGSNICNRALEHRWHYTTQSSLMQPTIDAVQPPWQLLALPLVPPPGLRPRSLFCSKNTTWRGEGGRG